MNTGDGMQAERVRNAFHRAGVVVGAFPAAIGLFLLGRAVLILMRLDPMGYASARDAADFGTIGGFFMGAAVVAYLTMRGVGWIVEAFAD